MNSPNTGYNNGDHNESRVYQPVEVEAVYKRESAILSQASAVIFFLIYLFFIFLPQETLVETFEVILSGVILVFSALAIFVIIVHNRHNINKPLKLSLSLVCLLTVGALVLDVLNPISAAMFQIQIGAKIVKAGLIIILMLLPISLFPALFLYREQLNRNLIIWSLWLFVFSVIPLLIIRVLKIAL